MEKAFYAVPAKSGRSACTWLPYAVHAYDAANMMERMADAWLPPHLKDIMCRTVPKEKFLPFCRFLGMVHDIGKMTALMTAKMADHGNNAVKEKLEKIGFSIPDISCFVRTKDKSDHAKMGEAILLENGVSEDAASIIGAHHGMPQSSAKEAKKQIKCYPANYYGCYSGLPQAMAWRSMWRQWIDYSLKEAGFSCIEDLPHVTAEEAFLYAGMLIAADWLASNEDCFPLIPLSDDGTSLDMDARFRNGWHKAGLTKPWTPTMHSSMEDSFREEFGFSMNDMQKAAVYAVQGCRHLGMLIIEAPMGTGKTEAAFACAEIMAEKTGCGGMFYGLPTQATADGIFPRMLQWAKGQSEDARHAIKLAHGNAMLNSDYADLQAMHDSNVSEESGLSVNDFFNNPKENLFSEFVIGTVDQLLMAGLKQRHVMLRLLGLSGKVVVLDEVHAYDSYMNEYLDSVLSMLGTYEVPVIILSATLPKQRRDELLKAYTNSEELPNTGNGYPLLTWTDNGEIHQQALETEEHGKTVKIKHGKSENIADYVRTYAGHGCTGIVMSTVQRSEETAEKLKKEMPDKTVLLLHAKLSDADRNDVQKEIMERCGKSSTEADRKDLVVVGTQILEQSLDIDFDFMVSDPCPMDLAMQRTGRLWRHDRMRPDGMEHPVCMILDEDGFDEGSEFVYGKWLLKRTKRYMPDIVREPEDISRLVQIVYDEPAEKELKDPEAWEDYEAYRTRIQEKKQRAEAYAMENPADLDTIHGILDGGASNCSDDEDMRMRAMVRDAEPSIDIVMLQRHADGSIGFFPWQEDGRCIDIYAVPDDETVRAVARQRVGLPSKLCRGSFLERTAAELDEMNEPFDAWRKNSLLRHARILLFDENMNAELCGHMLHYDHFYGLTCK